MTAINFFNQYKGIKGNQGLVHAGPTPVSGYQPQYHAPVDPIYTGIPDGRIVYVQTNGYLSPVCPASAATKFAMPLLLCEGGADRGQVPQTYAANSGTPISEAVYLSAFPQPNRNVMTIPLSLGCEFLTTEYDTTATYSYNQALTSVTTADENAGKVVPLSANTDMCIGFVSQLIGTPRSYGDPATYTSQAPNPMLSVTGKNQPGLSFWGHPLPCGAVSN